MHKEEFIEIPVKANYFRFGNTKNPKRLWLCCHGYGQLASRFVRKFEQLDPEENLVIVPEGQSHFYLEGLGGNVGASWMTKHNRLVEIENQFSYLETLMNQILKEVKPERITAFGFSQGGATICRWASKSEINFDDVFLWATIFPPDMSMDFLKETLKNRNVKLFWGDKDQFIKEEHLQKAENYLKLVPHLELIKYQGDHRVFPEILAEHLK